MSGIHYLLLALILLTTTASAQSTLTHIRATKTLTCGINQSEAEYNKDDEHGPRVAFDTDLCTAVAAAILGPHPHVEIKGYPDNETALTALRNHEVDLIPTLSADFTHSTQPDVSLTQPVLYDATALMVPRSAHIASVSALSNRKICFLEETETETNLRSWFTHHHLTLDPFPFQEQGEMEAAFVTGNCIALAGDQLRLADTRTSFDSKASDYTILPTTLATDPLAMAYRTDDPLFGQILTWTFNILLTAEAANVTSKNIATLSTTQDPTQQKLLGQTKQFGHPLGLPENWPATVISTTGNYAEIFTRDLGSASPLKLPRAQNNLSPNGGLFQPLPLK